MSASFQCHKPLNPLSNVGFLKTWLNDQRSTYTSKNASLFCRFLFYFSVCITNDVYLRRTFFSRKPGVIYVERPGKYIYIRLKKFISTTSDVYRRSLNKLLLRELVAELKTMWLLTWDIGYLSMICNIFEYGIWTWPQVMSLQTWLPPKLHVLLDI